MKRVLTALVLIPLVLLLVFLGQAWMITLAAAGLAALAAWEYLALTEIGGAKPPRVAVVAAILALFAGKFLADRFDSSDLTLPILGLLSLGLLVYCAFSSPVDRVMPDAAVSVFCLFYVGFTLLALPALWDEANGPSLVTFLFCVVWAGDIVALYVGRAFGRHKFAPRISPNKTWEGAAGSVAGSVAVAGLLLWLEHFLGVHFNSAKLSFPDEVWYWLVLAVVVNIAAQVGDLAESALKRSVGVKDSGTLLPGHGGVLDRIDALLLAAPVLWYAQILHQRF